MSKKSIPDEFVLAAIERAQRHRTHDSPGVPIWQVKEHRACRTLPARAAGALRAGAGRCLAASASA